MAETFHGSLLFYRWPPGNVEKPEIPWSEAPEACRSFLGHAVVAKYAGIWHGNDGRRESFPWSPEKRTAIAVVHLKDLSCADATALKRAFAEGPLECRKLNEKPASAVAWLPGHRESAPGTFNEDGIMDLMDLVRQPDVAFLEALETCIQTMGPHLRERMARRRYETDRVAIERALKAVRLASNPSPCSLTRVVLPPMQIATYLAMDAERGPKRSFATVLADRSPMEVFFPVRAGLGDPELDTCTVLRLLQQVLCGKALEAVRQGTAGSPRSGLLRSPVNPQTGAKRRRTGASDASRIVFDHDVLNLQCTLPKLNGKFSAIWVARYRDLHNWMFNSWTTGSDDLFNLGVVRFITSVTPCGRQVSVEPRIDELPLLSGVSQECSSTETVPLVTLLLQDLHQCFFAYKATSRALKARISAPSKLEDEDAMRQFLGLELGEGRTRESSWITAIFGAPRSRERNEFIEWTEKVLEKVWKPKQREFLREWGYHVAVADSAPGAGKTTIIMAICLGILHSKTQCRVFVAQPNKELCSRLVATLRRIAAKSGIPPAISRVGVNEASAHPVTDHLEDYVKNQTKETLHLEEQVLRALDKTLELLKKAYRSLPEPSDCASHSSVHSANVSYDERPSGFTLDPGSVSSDRHRAAILAVVMNLLALRHVYLNGEHYKKMEECKKDVLESLRVIVATPTKMLEASAGISNWLGALPHVQNTGFVLDEYHSRGFELSPPLIVRSAWACLLGDVDQCRDSHSVSKEIGDELPHPKAWDRDPFRRDSLPRWMNDNTEVQKLPLSSTVRLGRTMVRVLQRMFPNRHDELASDAAHDTPFLLVEFERLTDWVYNPTTREVQRSPTLFSHLLAFIVTELFALFSGPAEHLTKGILVVSLLNSFLSHFERFCEEVLPGACEEYLWICGRNTQGIYERASGFDFASLKTQGYLAFASAEKSGGRDCHVCFAVFGQRQEDDPTWAGHALQRHLQFISFSRASGRCYGFIEDLRCGAGSSASDAEARQAFQNNYQRQGPLVRLLEEGRREWDALHIPRRKQGKVRTSQMTPAPPAYSWSLGIRERAMTQLLQSVERRYWQIWWDTPSNAQSNDQTETKSPSVVDMDWALWHWRFLYDGMSTNSDCNRRMDATKLEVDVVQKYKPDLDGDVNHDFDRHRESWRTVTIDAITVHVMGASVVNVMVPVADLLLCPEWSWRNYDDDPGKDASFLCQKLSLCAAEHFKRSPYCIEVQNRYPGRTFEHRHGRHKKHLLRLGDDVTLLKEANSDRPFFALMQITPSSVDGGEPQEKELWHMYCAMGLPRQHDWQQSLLARCYDFHGAACILRAINEIIGRELYFDMISETLSKTATGREMHRGTFMTVLVAHDVKMRKGAPAPKSSFADLSGSRSTKAALAATSLHECTSFLREILSPDQISQVDALV